MRILRWIGRGLLGLLLLVLGVIAVAYVANPAIVRNLFTGPAPGVVTETFKNQPQERVPGVERDDIPSASADTLDPRAVAAAEAYAAQSDSVALLIWHRGALRYEKYWPGYDRNFVTDPFSAHKTVMALLLGAAIADGLIKSVDEPVGTYLPEWANDERGEIRIRDLLTMSSGLEFPRFGTWMSFRILLGNDNTSAVLDLPRIGPPGETFQYSNANSQLLGVVLQRAAGKRYAQYLSERLWSRIGAPTAAVWLDREGGMARTFCCLYTTARGWLQVGRLIMDRGVSGGQQVVPASWIAEMTTPSKVNPNYGYQIWLGSPPGTERRYNDKTIKAFHSEPFAASDIVFLDGFGGQRVYIVPSQELIVVRTGRGLTDWDDARIPNALLRGIRSAQPAPPEPAAEAAPAAVATSRGDSP